jgi:chitin synthase
MTGPGSIILILVGAFTVAFGITNDEALIINAVLVGSFIVCCIFAKADNQIRFAELLTVLYAIIMIAVYIGVALTVTQLRLISNS